MLSQLDTRNPVMHLEFPQGRLKLYGTLVYPKNKYVVLKPPAGGGPIICEDVFESLVVFSEAVWVGTKEENPGEAPLPMPASLSAASDAPPAAAAAAAT